MTREVTLTQGKVALVDDVDYERVAQFKWRASQQGHCWYAKRCPWIKGRKRSFYLHRFILGTKPGIQVDHKNLDGLDCRRDNLREATASQQQCNTRRKGRFGFRGIFLDQRRTRRSWRASIQWHGQKIYIGSHATPEEAARAYDEKARELFGEFARLNFPEERS